jgi:hypothetical protein
LRERSFGRAIAYTSAEVLKNKLDKAVAKMFKEFPAGAAKS